MMKFDTKEKASKLPISTKDLRFSDQALGALLMALQRCLQDQSDVTEILRGFKLRNSEIGLVVINPPILKALTKEKLEEMVEEESNQTKGEKK